MTYEVYKRVMKRFHDIGAQIEASPAFAKKYLEDSGLGDLLEDPATVQKICKMLQPLLEDGERNVPGMA